MKSNRNRMVLAASMAASLFSASAIAGGPLYLYDNQVPYAWDVSGPVPVYTDLGDLCDTDPSYPYGGCLTNDQADDAVVFGLAQWTGVASSSFQAEVAGDFSAIGLGDITGANAGDIVGTFNGGGYHVMYDADGSIIRDFFGAPPSVLGISSPEWAEGSEITESWAVINSTAVPVGDDGSKAAGVMTHEFGHGINLSHSQANGAITFLGAPWFWISWAPERCGAPYDVEPILDWVEYNEWIDNTMIPNTETMYPFIVPEYTGEAMSTVDKADDIAAVSNIYPGAGWPASHGTIAGEILLKDGETGLTGVNVVARNVADPLGDVVTVMSGDLSQGAFGPDGRYTLNGLTPGADYVVYVEHIWQGGFPTPPAALPSFQEYWNGANESTDASSDDPCEWTAIEAEAGSPFPASIAFQGIPRSPTYIPIPVPSATDVDNSGQVVAGTYGGQAAWTYNTRTGDFDTVIGSRATPRLARNGQTMNVNMIPEVPPWEGGMYQPGLFSENHGLELIELPEGEPGCDGNVFSPWDLTERGDTVVGLLYQNGCPRPPWNDNPNKFWAGTWNARDGLTALETPDFVFPDWEGCSYGFETGCPVYGSRANAISGDGSLIVGHVDASGWKGAAWIDGELVMLGTDTDNGFVGSANNVNHDGTVVVGGGAGADWTEAYIWSPETGTRNIGKMPCADPLDFFCQVFNQTEPFGVSDRGDLIVGRSGSFFTGFSGMIWMEELGMLDFGEFLQGQGIMEAYQDALIGPLAVSGDGKTIVGWGLGTVSQISFAVTLDQVWVCRNGNSRLTGFPGGMMTQLRNGATLGLCEQDRAIEPSS